MCIFLLLRVCVMSVPHMFIFIFVVVFVIYVINYSLTCSISSVEESCNGINK